VHLKVRFAPFFTQTKVRKLAEPTYDVGVVADTATAMFHELDDSREVRLLGVRGEMVPPEGGY
jgi:DNA polymerase-4